MEEGQSFKKQFWSNWTFIGNPPKKEKHKKMNRDLHLTPSTKINSKWILDLV